MFKRILLVLGIVCLLGTSALAQERSASFLKLDEANLLYSAKDYAGAYILYGEAEELAKIDKQIKNEGYALLLQVKCLRSQEKYQEAVNRATEILTSEVVLHPVYMTNILFIKGALCQKILGDDTTAQDCFYSVCMDYPMTADMSALKGSWQLLSADNNEKFCRASVSVWEALVKRDMQGSAATIAKIINQLTQYLSGMTGDTKIPEGKKLLKEAFE